MKLKRILALVTTIIMIMGLSVICFAEPTEDFHVVEETETMASGPKVEEYMVYVDDDKQIEPGSLSGDVNLNTVGRGLYFDGTDFYFFLDTGIMATNFMYNIEGDRFFFGDDGKMVKDQLVSYDGELYYFDLNGAMYKNRWYSQEEVDVYENTITYTDYYFGPTGRAYRASDNSSGIVIKTIDGERYGFNIDGEKVEGYYDNSGVKLDPDDDPAFENCVYYFDPDENGAATKGWHYYEGAERGSNYDDNEEIVLYFDEKTYRKVAAKSSSSDEDRCVSRIIEGQRYMFDQYGVRKNKWYRTEPGRGTASNAKYFSEEYDGYLQKGWFQAVPGSYDNYEEELLLDINIKKHESDEECWFYATSNGNILKKTIRKIGNYVYAFDDDGVMIEDSLVRVKNGGFVKSYPLEYLGKNNILLDYREYGGTSADPDPNGSGSPEKINKKSGLLNIADGEQWMYFVGETGSEDKAGSQAKLNTPVKVETNDDDVYIIQNSTGGYTKVESANSWAGGTDPVDQGKMSAVTDRGSKLIQNGVYLKPNPDDSNYGIVRMRPSVSEYTFKRTDSEGTEIPGENTESRATTKQRNWKNESVPKYDGTSESSSSKHLYLFRVVNANGVAITADYKSFKDKQGNYIYVGANGEFIGVYPYQGVFEDSAKETLNDPDGKGCCTKGQPCWRYKKSDTKEWIYGLPPKSERIDCAYLFLNISKDTTVESVLTSSDGDSSASIKAGPYGSGLAAIMYED